MSNVTLEQASTIVDVALRRGRETSCAPLTVAVLDAGGHLVAFKREDRSGIMTIAPATLLGLPQGRLSKGAPADLVLFDLERAYKIDAAKFRSKSKNSPFDEQPVQGRVLRTIVDGRIVFAAEG